MMVLEMFYEVTTFDLLPVHLVTDDIQAMLEPQEKSGTKDLQLSIQIVEAGYETANPFFNLTYPLSILAIALAINLLLAIMSVMSSKCSKVNSLINKQLRKMVWNFYLRMFIEEYLFIVIACIIKLNALDITTAFESVSSVFAIVMILFAFVFPLVIRRFLNSRYLDSSLLDERFD